MSSNDPEVRTRAILSGLNTRYQFTSANASTQVALLKNRCILYKYLLCTSNLACVPLASASQLFIVQESSSLQKSELFRACSAWCQFVGNMHENANENAFSLKTFINFFRSWKIIFQGQLHQEGPSSCLCKPAFV